MQDIDTNIEAAVQAKLDELVHQHEITIISAIESGSRSWGFPSPDSDYDVRFIYAHTPQWYIQLNPERDVIELPVNEVLDIGGWDVRKAMNLANGGNSVIQEWLISPLVYREDATWASMLRQLVKRTFNARATYHHYRSMAKSMMPTLGKPHVKLKTFFYISRATLSALWVVREHTMPTTVFPDLLADLTDNSAVLEAFDQQIQSKANITEGERGEINPVCTEFVKTAYRTIIEADSNQLPAREYALTNDDFRALLTSSPDTAPTPAP